MTPYKTHKKSWSGCTECELCEKRNRVVLARGKIPCDILFVGEAPGASEDVIGIPFVGPAGTLLDTMIEQSMLVATKYRWAMTNLVACIPRGEDNKKVAEPSPAYIKKCIPRLKEFIALAKPSVIICVGKLAVKWIPTIKEANECYTTSITHPAAILRADLTQQGLLVQRTIITIADSVEEI